MALKQIIINAVSALNIWERKRLLGLILLHTLVSIADVTALALLLAIVHYYAQPVGLDHSRFMMIFRSLQEVHFVLPLILFLLFFLVKNGLSFLALRGQFRFIYSVASRISTSKMRQYLNGSHADYTQLNPSVHVSRISYQPVEFCTFVLAGIQQLFTEATLTAAAVLAILLFNAKLFVLLLVILLPPVVLSAYFAKRRLKVARSQVKETNELATQHLDEALASYVESNVFSVKDFFTSRYAASQKRLMDMLSQLQVTQAMPPRFMELFAVFGLLALIVINRYAGGASIELVNIGAFMAAAYKIIPGITRMANTSAQMRMYAYTTESLQKELAPKSVESKVVGPIKEIAFQDVSFCHQGQRGLKHFNMTWSGGDFIGISSDSGRGKTTMINLLLGFLKPDSGAIRINGSTTSEAERRQFQAQIAYVKQQTFLIHDTIRANITLSDDGHDEARLESAIAMAGLNDFVRSFPEGIEKIVSDRGKNISGGQRQRIAVARAFYKEAPLLILDEPFNELDAASEQTILRHIRNLATAGTMVILIAHNSASLQHCNKIVSIHG